MTMLPRPLPGRIQSSGGRVVRLGAPVNNIRPYTVRSWRPPVPEPLPPAPLLGPKELLGLLALVLAQVWGRLNTRGAVGAAPGPAGLVGVTGTVGATGGKVAIKAKRYNVRQTGDTCYAPFMDGPYYVTPWPYFIGYGAGGVVLSVSQSGATACGYASITVTLKTGTGAAIASWTATSDAFVPPGVTKRVEIWLEFQDPTGGPGTLTSELPEAQRPAIPGTAVPIAPSASAAPAPEALAPLPAVWPGYTPGAVPVTDPSVDPAADPASLPFLPAQPQTVPLLKPLPPNRLPVVDGAVVAPAPLPTPTTDPDAVYPIPGRPPITGNGPRADLGEIAKELGRLEAKMHGMLNSEAPGNIQPDWLEKLRATADLAIKLWELLTATQAGGVYTLTSPCVLDANGDRIPTDVEYTGALGWLGVLSNKLDALAELQQAAKDLKQPSCGQIPAASGGQPVTVNFEQIS